MARKKTVEQELGEMVGEFTADKLIAFLRDILPLFELYDVQDEGDWVEDEVGADAVHNVRILRTFYLMSKIADNHSGTLTSIKFKYKGLWERMEKASRTGVASLQNTA